LQTISGVSAVMIWGEKRYAMRLWLDPVKLAGYGLTPLDVRNAIGRENVELPAGSIEGNTTELAIRTLGLMTTPKEFNDLIILQSGDQIVRFSDVGRAELGPEDIRGIMKRDGIPMLGTAIVPQPGSNHIEIADEVYRRLEMIKKDIPDDVIVNIGFDNTEFIRSSITEVRNTIFIAFFLVVLGIDRSVVSLVIDKQHRLINHLTVTASTIVLEPLQQIAECIRLLLDHENDRNLVGINLARVG